MGFKERNFWERQLEAASVPHWVTSGGGNWPVGRGLVAVLKGGGRTGERSPGGKRSGPGAQKRGMNIFLRIKIFVAES